MSKKFLSGINVTGTATLNTVANAGLDTDKFLVLDAAGNVDFRTGAELRLDIGADVVSRVQHEVKLGETMTIGTPVYIGVDLNSGTNMTVYKATNVTEAGSSKTIGLIASSGITNDLVQVVTEGLLAGLNTSTATKGDPVWLGANGALLFGLANKPVAPAHMVFLGIVTRVQTNNGEIFVKVQNGFEMNEIHNYLEGSVQNNQVVVYESATSLYKPKTIPTILGYTPVPDSRTITINGTTYDLTANRAWTITTDASARSILRYVATANQTTFTISGGYTPGLTDVYRNGVKLDNSTDFTATNGTTIVLTNGASVNDVIEVYRYQTAFLANNALRTVTEFIATAGQTTFNVIYNTGLVDVFYNGSKLLSTEYTAGNGTSIILNFPCNLNDTLEVHAYSYTVGAFTGQAQLNGTGFVKVSGTTVSYDNSTYLTASSAASTYLPLSGGALTGPLTGTTGTFTGLVRAGNDVEAWNGQASFTANSMIFWNTNNVARFRAGQTSTQLAMTIGSVDHLRVFTTGNVILQSGGTFTDAGFKLDVQGTTRLTGALSGTSATFSGNFLIGTTSNITGVLQVKSAGAGTNTNALLIYDNSANGNAFVVSNLNGEARLSASYAGSGINSDMTFYTTTSAGVSTEKLRIASTGAATFSSSVSIGTTNSSVRLNVQASANFENATLGTATGTMGYLAANGLYGMYIGIGNSGNTWLQSQRNDGSTTAYNLLLNPQGGNVLIGTTTDNAYKLNVNGTIYCSQIMAFGTTTEMYIGRGNGITGALNGNDFAMMNFQSGGRTFISNATTGVYLANGSTSWSTFSDERLKNINSTIENAIEKLSNIRAVNYSWKNDKTNKENLGLIAQDVEKQFPQIIDKSRTLNELDGNEYLSVRYTELIPILVKAIQELSSEVTELKALIAAK